MPELPIPSPYNFVPLSSRVFCPDWAAQVSHDVPFSDGVSGWLEIEVEAKTPVFIRGGGHIPKPKDSDRERWVNDENYRPETKQFARLYPGGPFAIPGTSLKGMIRSLLETVAFGKFQPVDGNRYAVRDLSNPDEKLYRDHLTTQIGGAFVPLSKGGWLMQDGHGDWWIEPCEVARVEQEDLYSFHPKQVELGDPHPRKAQQRLARWKYQRWGKTPLEVSFDMSWVSNHKLAMGRLAYHLASNLGAGSTQGTLVFTGQPASRFKYNNRGNKLHLDDDSLATKRGVKHMEFLFYRGAEQVCRRVPRQVVSDFRNIHELLSPSEDWAWWREKLKAGGRVPLFFTLDDNGEIKHLGLAQMFRLPYRFTPRDLARHQQPLDDPRPDLAETLFGRAAGEGGLRGRIHFEPLPYVEGTAKEIGLKKTVLGAPKPTYYPNYLEQELDETKKGLVTGTYATLMQEDPATGRPAARLRGWKQYRARADGQAPEHRPPLPRQDGSTNVATVTCFRPLDRGVRFRGRVHVHNLRPAELGALLWALTWGGDDDKLRHRLGLAKPLGYGNVQIRVRPESSLGLATLRGERLHPEDFPLLRARFERLMDDWCRTEFGLAWQDTPQFRAARALADPDTKWPNEPHHPADPKHFANYKRYEIGRDSRDNAIYASYALLPVPGVGFPPREAPPAGGPASPSPAPAPASTSPPVAPPPPATPPLVLTGHEVTVRITNRFPEGDPFLRFIHAGREHPGRLIPTLREKYKTKRIHNSTFIIAGPPDADGRHPLAEPED